MSSPIPNPFPLYAGWTAPSLSACISQQCSNPSNCAAVLYDPVQGKCWAQSATGSNKGSQYASNSSTPTSSQYSNTSQYAVYSASSPTPAPTCPPSPPNSAYPLTYTDSNNKTWSYMGCFGEQSNRALPVGAPNNTNLQGCVNFANQNGYNVLGLQYGNANSAQCWVGNNANYAQYGCQSSSNCPVNSSNIGGWTNVVYKLNS